MSKKLNIQAMKLFAKQNGLKLPKGKPEAAADVLKEHFEENFEEDDLSLCPMCQLPSGPVEGDDALTSCPYCGAVFDDEDEEDTDDDEEEVEEETEEVEEDEEDEEEVDEEDVDFEDDINFEEPVVEEKTMVVTVPHVEEEDDEVELDDDVFSDDEDGQGEVKETAIDHKSPELIQECKERTEKILNLKKQSAVVAYDIGVELKAINDQALYKSVGYDDFKAYCEGELDYTRMMAYKYISLTHLERDDTLKLGVTKSHLIVSAPERDRETLLDMAKNQNASRRDLEEYMKRGKQSVPSPEKSNKITLVGRVQDGEMFLPWVNAQGEPVTLGVEDKFAQVEIVTGIILTVELKEDKGVLLSFSKDEPAPAPKEELKPAKKPEKKEKKAEKKEEKKVKPAKKKGKKGKKSSKK